MSVVGNTEARSTEPSGPSIANAIPVEITVTATVVVPGQNSEDEEGPAMPAGIARTEPSLTEASSQTAAPESEAKATADSSAQDGAADAEPAATVAAVEPPSTDVTAPPATVSVDAVPVEITVTVTVVVPGQMSEQRISMSCGDKLPSGRHPRKFGRPRSHERRCAKVLARCLVCRCLQKMRP